MSASAARVKCLQELIDILKCCSEHTQWGMVLEASEELTKALHILKGTEEYFSAEEKLLLQRITTGLRQRQKTLEDFSLFQEGSNTVLIGTYIEQVVTELTDLTKCSVNVPTMEGVQEVTSSVAEGGVACKGEEGSKKTAVPSGSQQSMHCKDDNGGSHRQMLPGLSYLDITIDKLGIKDPSSYLDPRITVSIKNFHADDIETPQSTPVTQRKESNHILFGVPVLVQTPLEELPQEAAIFFEFQHYKPSKRKVSTKCFSFMEMDEIKPGKAALEIYKKPTDFHRKKLFLLSVKPLYLELTLNIAKHS